MPTKTTSPEAAQMKVWKAELRTHEKAASKVAKDFHAEGRRLHREVTKARKCLHAASTKALKFQGARPAKEGRAMRSIQVRIATLRGRLGI